MMRMVTMYTLLFRPAAVFRADHQHALSALDAKITRNLAGDKWHEAKRVIRSGSYSNSPCDSRSAERSAVPPDVRYGTIGFRVVLDAE